jgi:hypothetical protein
MCVRVKNVHANTGFENILTYWDADVQAEAAA